MGRDWASYFHNPWAQRTTLTPDQQKRLEALRDELKQPVLPLTHFCDALRTWMRRIEELEREHDLCECGHTVSVHGRDASCHNQDCGCQAYEQAASGSPPHGYAYASKLGQIQTDIEKSDLLGRLLYGGEELRTRKCPEHDGQWSGILPCPHGCGSTGWIAEDWPEGAERCSAHSHRPAVGVETILTHKGPMSRNLCWECYEESGWPK